MDVRARETLDRFIQLSNSQNKDNILDIGCGKLIPHTTIMKNTGLTVFTNDFFDNNDYIGKFVDINIDRKFGGIWCCHVLEHQPNINIFLRKIHDVLEDDGLLAITVPPLKRFVVGGHLTLWNMGLLYYNLIIAGFDCSHAIHSQYGYNISIILNKKSIIDMPDLYYDNGDIELLSKYFPFPVCQGFDGQNIPNTF